MQSEAFARIAKVIAKRRWRGKKWPVSTAWPNANAAGDKIVKLLTGFTISKWQLVEYKTQQQFNSSAHKKSTKQ